MVGCENVHEKSDSKRTTLIKTIMQNEIMTKWTMMEGTFMHKVQWFKK